MNSSNRGCFDKSEIRDSSFRIFILFIQSRTRIRSRIYIIFVVANLALLAGVGSGRFVLSSLLQTFFQGLFLLTVSTLFLSWLASIVKKRFFPGTKYDGLKSVGSDRRVSDTFASQQEQSRQEFQRQYDVQSSVYKEKVLIPREERRRQRKEEEFQKFLGPSWKGLGTALGGEDLESNSDDEHSGLPEGRKAAHRRKVPERINQVVATAAAVAASKKQKPKRVIKLPEEPDSKEKGVVTIMLRTPIGTTCQRRFYASDKVQCLLDFMTTQGFSQTRYTISTSYPRNLIEDPESTISDYSFGRRVALNIEEKD